MNHRYSVGKICGMLCITILLFSCADLDEPKPGALAPETFLEDQDDALDLLSGAYSGQYTIQSYLKPWIILNDIGSDDCGYLYAEFPERVQLDRLIYNPDYSDYRAMWWHHYMIINRAGLVIEEVSKMEDNVFESVEMKNRIIAEARFLRAYNYFNLIRLFGDVPYFGDTYSTDPVASKEMEKESVDVIYDFIIEELTKAKTDLWTRDAVEKGRATRGAAQAVLAKVFMTRAGWRLDANTGEMVQGDHAYWSSAATVSNELITEAEYELLDSFRLVFPAREEDFIHENGIEHIYFVNATTEGPWFETKKYYGPRRFDNGGAYSSYVGELELFNQFDSIDKRLDATYLTWVYDTEYSKRYNLNDPAAAWYWWPDLNIPHIGKYLPDEQYYEYPPKENLSGTNLILFRFAEVLLMYAEAQNEADGSPNGQAVEAYNRIRRRAGLSEWPNVTDPEGDPYPDSQDGFRSAVRQERRVELAFEQKRLFDLRRWGILEETFMQRASAADATQEDLIRSQNVTKYHNLFPIPYYEIQRNPGLKQNPGF
ncbi:MAG: RagB/SusD family nutrient uptake outer membrane protein [Bacteroidota bacterium]